MATLLLRELPDELHRKLKVRAAQNRRSMGKEALILLEMGLASDQQEFGDLPQPFAGNFLINDEWLAQAKDEGRA
jgi:plasmid stability protein